MSYKYKDLSVLAYANNFTLWHYTTPDNNVASEGYFNEAGNMLRANDLIIANFDTSEKPQTKFYIVTMAADNVVKIAAYA